MPPIPPSRVCPAGPADLSAALLRLLEEGGDGNAVVVEQGPAWIALMGQRGDRAVRCVAAARKQLPPEAAIGLEEVQRLRRAGFTNAGGAAGLGRTFQLGGEDHPDDVAALCLDLLARVYGRPDAEPVAVVLRLGDRDPTENPPLIEAMRASAKTRDGAARSRLYRAMLRSTFLVPMSGEAPRVVGEISGWDSYAAFTDAGHLERWAGRPVDFRIIRGRAHFPMLMGRRTGSLLVNPGGTVGGELYRNEVEAIANAVR